MAIQLPVNRNINHPDCSLHEMQDKVWDFSTKTQKKRFLLQSKNAFCRELLKEI